MSPNGLGLEPALKPQAWQPTLVLRHWPGPLVILSLSELRWALSWGFVVESVEKASSLKQD